MLAFRGEIEAQGRGSLHPHILVWLAGLSQLVLLRALQRDPRVFKQRVALWMKTCVVAMEATCQSSVQALPRRFGNVEDRVTPLPFTRTERGLTRFDGGSEIDNLRDEVARGVELSEAQQVFLEEEDDETWKRPNLSMRDGVGSEMLPGAQDLPRESVYGKRLDAFAVSQCPSYRRWGTLREVSQPASVPDIVSPEKDGPDAPGTDVPRVSPDESSCDVSETAKASQGATAAIWERLFAADVRNLAQEILLHICGDSCFKYSGSKVEHICRHGYYYIISLANGDWKRRRRGKQLRNALFVVRQTKYGMQGRVMCFQEHPFECQSNYGGLAALRCNFDVQDCGACSILASVIPRTKRLQKVG